MTALPQGRLLSFYGDDFTGSTAVMEVMTFAGLPTVLFLGVPTPAQLAPFADYRGIGIAGTARSRTPAWMDANLPEVFDFLAGLRAPVSHYKVCSTLDSAPHIGSIGKAADLAIPRLGSAWHPVLIAAPAIARYQAFGNLFAVINGEGFRLDRHPVMSRHPVTPMDEADVRRHLARQTDHRIELIDYLRMKHGTADSHLAALCREDDPLVVLDTVDEETLAEAGRLIWEHRGERLFAIGSQGVEYALVAHWRAAGLLPPAPPVPEAGKAERIAVVSGSCSPVTAAQIDHALERGFAPVAIDASLASDERRWRAELERALEAMLDSLRSGRDPLAFTARGPDDPSVARVAALPEPETVNRNIGEGLGWLVDRITRQTDVRRCVIAGGDTSGHAASLLGIHALSALAPIAPGSMLCRAHRAAGDLELALKGGQMGGADYFSAVKAGRAISPK